MVVASKSVASLLFLYVVHSAVPATVEAADDLPRMKAAVEQSATVVDAAQKEHDIAQAAYEQALNQRASAEFQLLETERRLRESAAELKAAEKARNKAEDARKLLEKKIAELQKSLKATTDPKVKAELQKQRKSTEKQLTDAESKLKKARETLQEKQQADESARSTNEPVKQKLTDEVAKLEKLVAERKAVADQTREQVRQTTARWIANRTAIEQRQIAAGERVSFAASVAPVFHARCVACHNARSAKGRLNMETFAALMKGGESGAVIEPGDVESSYLVHVIEDGSMPQDADPLTAEEIATIRQWIATGAHLDAAAPADANLLTIMPRRPQPAAPETYRATIPVTAVAYNNSGELLATSGYHEVLLWNPADGRLVQRIGNVAERVYDLQFSADGNSLAVAAGTPAQIGEVKIFRVADGELVADFGVSGDSVFGVAYSPDGQRLASCGADRTARVWEISTERELVKIENHADWVMDVAWSADGKLLATASRDKTAKVFDAETGAARLTFSGHAQPVFGVRFQQDTQMVVTCGEDKQLRIWRITDAKQMKNAGGIGGAVFALASAPDNRLLSASADGKARWHQLPNGNATKTFDGSGDWLYAVTYSKSRNEVAAGGYDGRVTIWDADTGKRLRTILAAPGLTNARE